MGHSYGSKYDDKMQNNFGILHNYATQRHMILDTVIEAHVYIVPW